MTDDIHARRPAFVLGDSLETRLRKQIANLTKERDEAREQHKAAVDNYITMSFREAEARDEIAALERVIAEDGARIASLMTLPDRMPIESLHGADGASVWLREEIAAAIKVPS